MKEKKIDRHSIINELTNSSLKTRYEIHYPNGNDFI